VVVQVPEANLTAENAENTKSCGRFLSEFFAFIAVDDRGRRSTRQSRGEHGHPEANASRVLSVAALCERRTRQRLRVRPPACRQAGARPPWASGCGLDQRVVHTAPSSRRTRRRFAAGRVPTTGGASRLGVRARQRRFGWVGARWGSGLNTRRRRARALDDALRRGHALTTEGDARRLGPRATGKPESGFRLSCRRCHRRHRWPEPGFAFEPHVAPISPMRSVPRARGWIGSREPRDPELATIGHKERKEAGVPGVLCVLLLLFPTVGT
jgi:hypothetical protein